MEWINTGRSAISDDGRYYISIYGSMCKIHVGALGQDRVWKGTLVSETTTLEEAKQWCEMHNAVGA